MNDTNINKNETNKNPEKEVIDDFKGYTIDEIYHLESERLNNYKGEEK